MSYTPEEITEILEAYFDSIAHRQYIGSRYVPIFGRVGESSCDWDNTGDYEPLTIVLYQGNSYTSRQFVPAGADISNTDYWVLTGNFNAQVEQYRVRLVAMENALPIADFDSTNTVKKYVDDTAESTLDSAKLASAQVFDTVADMQAATLEAGMICHTNGFHAAGDNGAAWYEIKDTGTANGMDVIACGDLYAEYISADPYIVPEKLGAYADGENGATAHDDADVFDHIVNTLKKPIQLSSKSYWISRSIITDTTTAHYISINGNDTVTSRYGDIGIDKGCVLRISEPLIDYGDTISDTYKGVSGNITGVRFVNVSSDNVSIVKTEWLMRCNLYAFLFNHNTTNGFYGAFKGRATECTKIVENKFQQLEMYFFYGLMYDGIISGNHLQGVGNVPSTPNGSVCFYITGWNVENVISDNYIDYWNYPYYIQGAGKTVKSINNQYGQYAKIIQNIDSVGRTFWSINDYFATPTIDDENKCAFTVKGIYDYLYIINPQYNTNGFSNSVPFIKLLADVQGATNGGDCYIGKVHPDFFNLIDLNGFKIPISERNFSVDPMFLHAYTTDTLPSVTLADYKGEYRIFNTTTQKFMHVLYTGGHLEWSEEA